ncbi:RDD family protein [Paenibacillus sp. IB182496]|uniref:RDD family protein n=1 Tax=Paenibacillus sabuli TaxID=2772509 RepID=A0A927BWA2_9BACL|nr:RDD family protein [Paenibacillus sabuli]MBD2848036.1 RDD family protein [Paenibacillus sabuli]
MQNASFISRCKAFLLDYVIILGYLALLAVVNLFVFPELQQLFIGSPLRAQLAGFVMVTLPVSLYFIFGDARGGGTFGKRRIGIRVADRSGYGPGIARMVFRTAVKFLPWELAHFLAYRLSRTGEEDAIPTYLYLVGGTVYALMLVYILTAIFTPKKQALYDLIASTRVVAESGRTG